MCRRRKRLHSTTETAAEPQNRRYSRYGEPDGRRTDQRPEGAESQPLSIGSVPAHVVFEVAEDGHEPKSEVDEQESEMAINARKFLKRANLTGVHPGNKQEDDSHSKKAHWIRHTQPVHSPPRHVSGLAAEVY